MDVRDAMVGDRMMAPEQERYESRDDAERIVARALQSMPDDLRLPLVMRYITGDSYTSIAERLSMSEGGARSRVRRARDQFATYIRRAGMENDCHQILQAHLAAGSIAVGWIAELSDTLDAQPPPDQADSAPATIAYVPAALAGCVAALGLVAMLGGTGDAVAVRTPDAQLPVYLISASRFTQGASSKGYAGNPADTSWLPPGSALALDEDFSGHAARVPLPEWTSGAYSEPDELGPDGRPGVGVITTNIPRAYFRFPLTKGTVSIELWVKPHRGSNANFGIGVGNVLAGWSSRSQGRVDTWLPDAGTVNDVSLVYKDERDMWAYHTVDSPAGAVPFADYDGEWHHVRIVCDVRSGLYDCYLDGVLIRRRIPRLELVNGGISHLGLNSGRWKYETDEHGYFDDLRIYLSEEPAYTAGRRSDG